MNFVYFLVIILLLYHRRLSKSKYLLMKFNLVQTLIAFAISVLLVVLVGGEIKTENKFLFEFVSTVTLFVYLAVLIGIRFENKKIAMNFRALSLIFIVFNLIIVLVFSKSHVLNINRFLAIEFIQALIFLSICVSLFRIKKV